MSYSDQTSRRSPTSIAAVVGVHLAIGYALISGLAYKVFREPPLITVGEILPDDPPPPPKHDLPPPDAKPTNRTAMEQPLPPNHVEIERTPTQTIDVTALPDAGLPRPTPLDPPPPPKLSLARSAIPGADRLRWITTDDYPTAALRQGLTGSVAISVMVGSNGRVQSCEVTASSGSRLLDDTTCRLYASRAHFSPALDDAGNAVAVRRADRFRWQIPN